MADLARHVAERHPVAYLVTVGPQRRPHVVAVEPRWDDDELVVAAGRHSSGNVLARPAVTLVWPPAAGGAYALIVDGDAEVLTGPRAPNLAVAPSRAVLHRTPAGDPGAPSCITVLSGTVPDRPTPRASEDHRKATGPPEGGDQETRT